MTDDHAPAVDQITPVLAEALRRNGSYRHTYYSDREREVVRRSGENAAHRLDQPVEITDSNRTLHLVLTGQAAQDGLESQLDDARTRNAIDYALRDTQQP